MNEIIVYVLLGGVFALVCLILIIEAIKQLKWEFYDD